MPITNNDHDRASDGNEPIPFDAKATGEVPTGDASARDAPVSEVPDGKNGDPPAEASAANGNGVAHDDELIRTDLRKKLFEHGYVILPNRGKVPVLKKGWNEQEYVTKQLTDNPKRTALQRIERWPRLFPYAHSTGVWIANGLGVIDCDVDDAAMIAALLEAIPKIAPEIADKAPMRYGGGEKVALFVRVADEGPEKAFIRRGSLEYLRPGETDTDKAHAVEIFGGKRGKYDRCSRQFGVYGPHSYADDGVTVKASYRWAEDRPALHEVALNDLPVMTEEVACKILNTFEELARAAGWTWVETHPDTDKDRWAYILVDDPSMLFNDNMGGVRLRLPEVIDNYPPDGSRYTVASSFIPGDPGTNPDKCLVGWSDRLNCITIWNSEEDVVYAPADKKPVDDWSQTPLGEFLRKRRDEYGDGHGGFFSRLAT
jgi:hypothetical protein